MAHLLFKSDHNKTAFLTKVKTHEEYDPMVNFLLRYNIHFALTTYPNQIFVSLVQQFWNSAKVMTSEDNPTRIKGTVDGVAYEITESLVRTKLQLDDADGVYHNNYDEVLAGLIEAGYQHDNTKVWKKKGFCPKWRYLVHTLLQCIIPKFGG